MTIEALVAMRNRVKQARPDVKGTTAGDGRPSSPKAIDNAIKSVAAKYKISEEDALFLIQDRDRISGYWFGWVDAAKAIIKEMKSDA